MAIRAIEAKSKLRLEQLDLLLRYYDEFWTLPTRHVYCFAAFALLGSYQAQFQERNKKLTPDDVEHSIKRVMRTIGPLFIGHTPVPACQAFDQLEHKARMFHREYLFWIAEMHHGKNSVLSKYARNEGTDFETVLGGLWWEAREKYWPKRDTAQYHEAMRYALNGLGLVGNPEARQAMLLRARAELFALGGMFINKEGALHLGGRDARDILAKTQGFSRPRPDRERKRRRPKTWLDDRPEQREAEDDFVDTILRARELAGQVEEWRKGELRGATRGSNKRILLLYLGSHSGRRPPIRELARKHGRDQAGISRAWSSLALALQAHLARRASE